jgi:hypothetical protein
VSGTEETSPEEGLPEDLRRERKGPYDKNVGRSNAGAEELESEARDLTVRRELSPRLVILSDPCERVRPPAS